MEDNKENKELDITKNNNQNELENLSVEQINDLFSDIIELPDDYFIAAASTSSKHCHNSRC